MEDARSKTAEARDRRGVPREDAPPRRDRSMVLGIAIICALKLIASAIVLAIGFRAVSDDDYARVVIAQDFARAPKLDPSGTSWLPFPFWLTGGVMMVLGRSLFVARALAVAQGVAASALVYVAARWLQGNRRAALLGGALAAITPWSAMLGVSTVPELPTAALLLIALASLGSPSIPARPIRWVVGGAALLIATLSRYEAWFIAPVFAWFVVRDARALRGGALAAPAVAVALAALGPIAWIVWNAHAHGSPTAFLSSVVDYNEAVAHPSFRQRLITYPHAFVRFEPELFAIALTAAVAARADRVKIAFRPMNRARIACAVMLAALIASSLLGGAPTHHPERALLLIALVIAIATARMIVEAWPVVRAAAARWALVLVVVAAASWPTRRYALPGEVLSNRTAEVDIGERARAALPPGERAFLEAVDYGYFAVQAASGTPEAFEPRPRKRRENDHDLIERASWLGFGVAVYTRTENDPIDGTTTLASNASWTIAAFAKRSLE